MQTEEKLTSYSSIDKLHYKLYCTKPIREIETEQTKYELVFNSNKGNMNAPALSYMGIEWIFEKLKRAASAFAESGIKKGDVVGS